MPSNPVKAVMPTLFSRQIEENNSRTSYHQFLDRRHPDQYRQYEVKALVQAYKPAKIVSYWNYLVWEPPI